ncbi:MAG: fructose bisphosphate aldolase [Deltaproteobacteria bacterium]|nr:fructose bisphosphate aldolase [Deltaproteobacteria bacterium]
MKKEQLNRIRADKGFVAALDQSGGSTPKALALYGVPQGSYPDDEAMFDLVHAMRTRIIMNDAFDGNHILGAILFEDTMDRLVGGEPTADYLWGRKRIVPFLKVDKGLIDMHNGVQLMRPMPGLEALLEKAVKANIFGTKMRSVIKEPNTAGIAEAVAQQFAVARRISMAGLIPILEPEVDIHCPQRHEAEVLLRTEVERHLAALDENTLVMFKFTIPEEDNFYAGLLDDPHVVRIVALSGGFTQAEACERLARNTGLIASFSRALLEGLRVDQTDEEFSAMLQASVAAVYAASIT